MFVLSKNTYKPITHVIHIADTHVRTGDRVSARIDEYTHVFGNFIDEISKIKAVKEGTALLVIAGDIFHHKGKLETEGATMIYEWLNRLLDIIPVLMICGNHDFRQEDPKYKDMIEMLIAPYKKHKGKYPIHYLHDTGHYVWENIGFGVTSVKDTLQTYNTCGILTDLPKYPDPGEWTKTDIDCVVALFHGSITQSAMPSGKEVSEYASGYPLEWFSGYDIAMFGDNHTQQLNSGLNNTLVWGYPGSLVQQDGGESFLGHGYILWDIKKKSGKCYHVHNDYATLNMIRTKKDDILVRLKAYDTVSLDKAMSMKEFPLYPQIRVMGIQGDDTIIQQKLKDKHIHPHRIYLTKCIQKAAHQNELVLDNTVHTISHLIDLNKPDIWKKFVLEKEPNLANSVTDWIYNPSKLLFQKDEIPDTLHDKILNKNRAIQQTIDCYDKQLQHVGPCSYNIILQHMEWEYLMCYGPNNWFDFTQIEGKIALLNGKNASGKSSFIDVVCLAIFGDPTIMRSDIHGSKMTVKVIHDQKPTTSKHDSAYVKLLFHMNDELYEIKRSFTVKQKDEVLQSKVNKIATIHKIVDNVMIIIADGTTMVNEWISKRFGSLPEILMSTILCQNDSSNFFSQKSSDQVHIIEKALHMESIHEYECILYEASKANKYMINELVTYMRGIYDDKNLITDDIEEVIGNIHISKEQKDQCQKRKEELTKISEELLLKIKGEIDTYGYDLKEAEEGLQKEQDNVNKYPDLTPDIIKTIHEKKTRLDEQENALKSIHRLADNEISDIDKYQTSIVKSIEVHLRKKPDEPELTEAYIERKEAEYSTWSRTIKYMEIDLKELNNTIKGLLDQQKILYQDQNLLHQQSFDITKPQTKFNEWLKEWERWESFIGDVSDMTVDELKQRYEAIKEYLKKIDDTTAEYTALENEIDSLKKEKATYSNIEFNPDCNACQKNPLRQRLNNIIQHLKELETKRKKIQKKIMSMKKTEDDYRNEMNSIQKTIQDRMAYELRIEYMTKEHEEWEKSAKLWKQKEEHQIKIETLHTHLKGIFHELQGLQKIKTEHDVWEKENIRILNEKEVIQIWNKWNNIYQTLLTTKQNINNTIMWQKIQDEKKCNELLFKRINAYENAIKERDEWNNIVLSIRWIKIKKELEEIIKKEEELKSTIVLLEAISNRTQERRKLTQICETALKNYQEKYETLQQFIKIFVGEKGNPQSGFKAWIYNSEIIPLMEREVNRFIEPLDDIRLKITYHNGELLYNLQDRGNCPTLDYASGYQRFLVGIAMRIALSSIGAIGQNVLHLIIDEGFMACDSTNILKVDTILKSMMELGNYKSVLLMSHLDIIRDTAQATINITRSEDNIFSKISWGFIYPVFNRFKKAELLSDVDVGKKTRNTLKKIK